MAGMCCGVVGEVEASAAVAVAPISKALRRRRMEVHQFKLTAADALPEPKLKKRKTEPTIDYEKKFAGIGEPERERWREIDVGSSVEIEAEVAEFPKFGSTSVCGRRRDMEDAVAIRPSFGRREDGSGSDLHFFGVYDGHGCSHVAMKCKDRLHDIVKDEIETRGGEVSWKETMVSSFLQMDKEVSECSAAAAAGAKSSGSSCRCELQTPHCDAVGSTAVVSVVTPEKIIVSNCGDSRAVLCRNGVAIPLSADHKPDRPDELERIESAGGRVIYWDGARVLGVLAMSRAIGDSYLKPFVISNPEVTVIERTEEDECLILASDGLWDVVSNETACSVAKMCLQCQKPPSPPQSPGSEVNVAASGEGSDKGCFDASILLTKLALARHSTDNVFGKKRQICTNSWIRGYVIPLSTCHLNNDLNLDGARPLGYGITKKQ